MKNSTDLSRTKSRWKFLKPFCFLFTTISVAAFLLYFGLASMLKESKYVSPVVITDGYHGAYLREITQHPFAYLLTISFLAALFGASWIVAIAPRYKRFHSLQLLLIPWVALIVTSPVWGVIWSVYRHPAGFSDASALMHYRYDAMFGLSLGWISAIASFPINLLSYITVYLLLLFSKKLFWEKHPAVEAAE
jgi:hypothetical protein